MESLFPMLTPVNSPMKILHLARNLEIGGLESVVKELIQHAGTNAIEPYLGCLYKLGSQGEGLSINGRWEGHRDQKGRLRTFLSLWRYVRRHQIQLLHSHNPLPHLYAVWISLVTGIPVVHTKHGRNYPDNPRRVWLNRQLSRWTKYVVAVSEDAASVALKIEKIPSAKVLVIRNGIDTKRFCSDGREPRNAVTVGTVGRLCTEKNHALLINAFSLVNDALDCDLKLLIVGDGPEREALEKMASGVNIEFVGMQQQVEHWLSKMDIFCLSSHTEGTSMTLLEAAACGLPCIVTDVGGNREIVEDEVTGLIVAPDNVKLFADAIRKCVVDADLRRTMGQNGRKKVLDDYSVQKMAAEYAKLYSGL